MQNTRALPLLSLLALAACGGENKASMSAASASTGGTLVVSTPSQPDNLLPPITTSLAGKQVNDLVYERLAEIDSSLITVGDVGFTPSLAIRWIWAPDSLSIAFHLDSAARWHDGVPVRASDVVFSFALFTDPKTASPSAPLLANIDSVTVRDSLTAVAWFHKRTPEQFFEIAFQLYVLPKHRLADADRTRLASSPLATLPIGSGPFRVVRWEPNQVLELAADTTGGRRRAMLDRVVFTMAPDPVIAFTRVATGEADLYETVRPDKLAEARSNAQLVLTLSPALDYNYLGFNLVDASGRKPHRIFGDRVVRRALTMATDRRGIVANIYDSLAIQARGPFTVAQASADTSLRPLPYSVDSANALLDEAGWKRGPDSLRAKGATPLRFGILVPTTSVARMRAAVLFQEQFRRIGADVRIESADMAGFMSRMDSRNFDTILGGWAPDPGPGSVRDAWTSSGAITRGNNLGSYRSPAFDAQVDSGTAAFDPAAMRVHFARAWRIIADDAPAIWLAEPRRAMAVNSRIVTSGMRPDAWWAGVAKWYIPAEKRIARDAPAASGASR